VTHALGVDTAIDMINNPKLAEGSIKESAPGGEVGVTVVESHRHVGANVDVLDR
jgi:hypothetical protein